MPRDLGLNDVISRDTPCTDAEKGAGVDVRRRT
jgi:hypothetical protein